MFNIFSEPFRTRSTRTPAFWGYPPPPNDYPYHWVILDPKSKEDKIKVTNLKKLAKISNFWNGHYTRHTFWSCLIRCANIKWIRWVLLKIQSGHDSVHRRTDGQTDGRTDGQTDKVIPVYPLFKFVAGGIKRIGLLGYIKLHGISRSRVHMWAHIEWYVKQWEMYFKSKS